MVSADQTTRQALEAAVRSALTVLVNSRKAAGLPDDVADAAFEALAALAAPAPADTLTQRAIALTLAHYADPSSKIGDTVPQTVWDALHAEGLIETVRDITDEGVTQITSAGLDALLVLASLREPAGKDSER